MSYLPNDQPTAEHLAALKERIRQDGELAARGELCLFLGEELPPDMIRAQAPANKTRALLDKLRDMMQLPR